MSRPHTPAFQLRRPNLPQGNPNGSSGLGPGGRSTPTLGRATISLEEWERQAPLSDEQQGVVREVSGRLEQRELPEKVCDCYPLLGVVEKAARAWVVGMRILALLGALRRPLQRQWEAMNRHRGSQAQLRSRAHRAHRAHRVPAEHGWPGTAYRVFGAKGHSHS